MSDLNNKYHPSRWEPVVVQHVAGYEYLILCGPGNVEPLVSPLSLVREDHALRLERWRRFGGKCPTSDFMTLTQWVHWHLSKQSALAQSWGNALTFPNAVYKPVLGAKDVIREHELLGKDLFTLSIEQLNCLVPQYRHMESVTLDLVLCQVWFDLGRTYRVEHLSQHSKYLYKIYTKLPKTYARYKLTYHQEAPCYHT